MKTSIEEPCESVKGSDEMGRVVVEAELSNATDEELAAERKLPKKRIRKITLAALVDTGATMLSIPPEQIERLGLRVLRQATSKYADGRREARNIYGAAMLRVAGRMCIVEVLAGHAGQPALLGQIPLESLDLLVDPRRQRLIPNPESPDMPMVEVY